MAKKLAKAPAPRDLLRVCVSRSEAAAVRDAARRRGYSMSRFVREAALAEIRRLDSLPLLRAIR